MFTALDFLAELTQHIPDKGEHLVRYYGWYSHRQRGIRARSAPSPSGRDDDSKAENIPLDRSARIEQESSRGSPRAGSVSTWAMLIQRVYEVDPLECAQCGGRMKIVSFIERRQQDVIERILRHCGLWEGPVRTLANPRASPRASPGEATDPQELELVLDAEFLEAEFHDAQEKVLPDLPPEDRSSPELQLVLDPEFL